MVSRDHSFSFWYKAFIFTLIYKFGYDKTEKYPVLSARDDIIVLVDEAHRTQYKDLAENMRTALPNANFVAFTGTPLLGTKHLTNQWFGDYVSEYNFKQSVEDGSTVPLFYSRRVPEVGLENDFLDDDVVDIIEEEKLNEDETRLLENASSRIFEVIKREDRLDKVAQDIAYHFPRRGFLGKGMVVSVDKYTAVKMYDKVQHYWAIEKQNIMKERNTASTKEERDQLTRILAYMNKVEMAVIISEENDEETKFAKQGLKISEHRAKMKEITPNGRDIEDRFKDPDDSLQLVFVCAMWLTGFDVKNLSTLYLDKPMKGHTLMQAIARANRVYPGKPAGIIVDYVNVFKYMKKALTEYATGDDGTEFPAKDIDQLISYIDGTIDEADSFLLSLDIDLKKIIADSNTLDKLDGKAVAVGQPFDYRPELKAISQKLRMILLLNKEETENPNKRKVEQFLERSKRIKAEEYHPAGDGFAISYVSGPKYNAWMSEISIFNERHLKDHPLHQSIDSTYFHRANRPSSFDDMVGYLEALLLDNEYWDEPISSDYKFKEIEVNQEMSNKVFIVHGHDTSAKESMARTLEKAGFEAIILHEQADAGMTIIEKIEKYTDVSFAVVLYTECNLGRAKELNESENKYRARQNVVFEHGYLIGKLGRGNVCALVKGNVETPGDISGVVYIPMDENGAWKMQLCKNMQAAGLTVDANKMI